MLLFRLAIQYLWREKARTILAVIGLASAFGAAAFMYGAAGQVAHEATRSLSWVIDDADLWLVPPVGMRLDPVTGALVCDSRLPNDVVDLLSGIDQDATIAPVVVALINDQGTPPVVVYFEVSSEAKSRAVCSADLWESNQNHPFSINTMNLDLTIVDSDPALPPRVIFATVSSLPAAPSWLKISTKYPGRWVRSVQDVPYIVRDTPAASPQNTESLPILHPITIGAGRFNAFSFNARFDAFILNSKLGSSIGLFARVVLVFGSFIAITSIVLGLREKRALIAVLAASGISSEMVGVLLAESGVLIVVSWLLGTGVAVATLSFAAFPGADLAALLKGVAVTAVVIPSLVMGATLFASSRILSVPPVRLIKGSFA